MLEVLRGQVDGPELQQTGHVPVVGHQRVGSQQLCGLWAEFPRVLQVPQGELRWTVCWQTVLQQTGHIHHFQRGLVFGRVVDCHEGLQRRDHLHWSQKGYQYSGRHLKILVRFQRTPDYILSGTDIRHLNRWPAYVHVVLFWRSPCC